MRVQIPPMMAITDILTDNGDDPVREELLGAIRELNEEERVALVALAWLGRGTYELPNGAGARHGAHANTGSAPPNICSACRCWAIIWKTGCSMFGEGIVDDSDTREGLDEEDEPLGRYACQYPPPAFAPDRCYGHLPHQRATRARGRVGTTKLRDSLKSQSRRQIKRAGSLQDHPRAVVSTNEIAAARAIPGALSVSSCRAAWPRTAPARRASSL